MTKDDLLNIKISSYDHEVYEKCKKSWDNLAKPLDGFGDFEDVVSRIIAINNSALYKRAAVIFCSDNGIVEEGVSQCGSEVTRKVAQSLGAGISTVSVLGRSSAVDIIPVDIGIRGSDGIDGVLDRKIAEGTKNFLKEPAMTEDEVLRAIETGIEIVRDLKEKGYSILAAGEMGIGNTTTSAALLSALLNIEPEEVTGRGAGLDDAGYERKLDVIRAGVQKYSYGSDKKDYILHILRCLGGFDIAGLTGLVIGGAMYHIPIVLDGFITGAAAVCAEMLVNGVKDFVIPSHSGREAGNKVALSFLGHKAFINGNMALGEGTGAVMLFPLLDTVFYYFKNGSDFSTYRMDAYERF